MFSTSLGIRTNTNRSSISQQSPPRSGGDPSELRRVLRETEASRARSFSISLDLPGSERVGGAMDMDGKNEIVEVEGEEDGVDYLKIVNPSKPDTPHLRLSPPFPHLTEAEQFPSACSLLAVSNVWGLVVVGSCVKDEVLIYKLQDISKAATDSSPADSAKTISTVTLNARAQWVRLAAGDKKVLVGLIGGGIFSFDLKELLSGNTSPLGTFTQFTSNLLNLLPNPSLVGGLPNIASALSEKGIAVLDVTRDIRVVATIEGKFGAVAWSVKGKQFVVGKADGTLEQYTPDGTPRSSIPLPTALAERNEGFHPTSINWLENDVFLVNYSPAATNPGEVPETIQYIVHRQAKASPVKFTFTAFYDPIPMGMQNKTGGYKSVAHIKGWGSTKHLLFLASAPSPDVMILRTEMMGDKENPEWKIVVPDETARPSVPMNTAGDDMACLGMELDLTNATPIKQEMEGGVPQPDLPPMPRLLVYTSDGVLATFNVVNNKDGAYGEMVEPRDILAAADDVDTPVVEGLPQSTGGGDAAAAAAKAKLGASAFGSSTPNGSPKPSFGFGGTKIPSVTSGFAGAGSGFGGAAKPTTSGFGSSAFGSPAFGGSTTAPAPASAFGSPAFGSPAATPPATSSSGSAFGSSAFGQAKPAFGGSAFGTASNNSTGAFRSSSPFGGSAFGKPASGSASPAASSPAIEEPKKAPAFGASAFGGTPTGQPATFGGSGFSFGSSTPTPATKALEAKPKPAFGTSTFGSSGQSSFGQSAFTPSAFGAPKPAEDALPQTSAFGPPSAFGQGSGFGQPAASKASPFGSSAFGSAPAFGAGSSSGPKPVPADEIKVEAPAKTETKSAFSFGDMGLPDTAKAAASNKPKAEDSSSLAFGDISSALAAATEAAPSDAVHLPPPPKAEPSTAKPLFSGLGIGHPSVQTPAMPSPAFGSGSTPSATTAPAKPGYFGFGTATPQAEATLDFSQQKPTGEASVLFDQSIKSAAPAPTKAPAPAESAAPAAQAEGLAQQAKGYSVSDGGSVKSHDSEATESQDDGVLVDPREAEERDDVETLGSSEDDHKASPPRVDQPRMEEDNSSAAATDKKASSKVREVTQLWEDKAKQQQSPPATKTKTTPLPLSLNKPLVNQPITPEPMTPPPTKPTPDSTPVRQPKQEVEQQAKSASNVGVVATQFASAYDNVRQGFAESRQQIDEATEYYRRVSKVPKNRLTREDIAKAEALYFSTLKDLAFHTQDIAKEVQGLTSSGTNMKMEIATLVTQLHKLRQRCAYCARYVEAQRNPDLMQALNDRQLNLKQVEYQKSIRKLVKSARNNLKQVELLIKQSELLASRELTGYEPIRYKDHKAAVDRNAAEIEKLKLSIQAVLKRIDPLVTSQRRAVRQEMALRKSLASPGPATPGSSRQSTAPIQLATNAMNAEVDGDILLRTARDSSSRGVNASTMSASGRALANSTGERPARPKPINGKFASAPVVLRLKPILPPCNVYPNLPSNGVASALASPSINTNNSPSKFSFTPPADGSPEVKPKFGILDFGIKSSLGGLDNRSRSSSRSNDDQSGPSLRSAKSKKGGGDAASPFGMKKVVIAGETSGAASGTSHAALGAKGHAAPKPSSHGH